MKIEITNENFMDFIGHNSKYIRFQVAKKGFGLEQLIHDEAWEVREEVAKQGYGLERLVKDDNKYVRAAVAKQGYGLKELVNDKTSQIPFLQFVKQSLVKSMGLIN